jgi:hypothetical protein
MQTSEGSSFVWENKPKTMPITIKLKDNTPLSLDGVNKKTVKKGEVLTSKTNLQHRLFEHLVESGKADIVGAEKQQEKQNKKVVKPKETKNKTTKKSKK